MAASGDAGASTSTPAPPSPSTLDASRISVPPSTLARTSPLPSTLYSSRGQVMDGGEPLMRTDGGGAPLMRTDAACVGKVGGQGIDEPESRADDGGGDDPQMRTDAGGGKRPQTSQCKNSEVPSSQRKKANESCLVRTSIMKEKQKVVKANDKIDKKVLPLKDKHQKVDKANEKTNKKVLPLKDKYQKEDKANEKTDKQVLPLKEKNQKVVKANEKIEKNVEKKASQKQRSEKREANIRNIKSASPQVSSPVQVTSSPGVNYLVRAAAVKKEALKRSNMGGSPSTPQRPSQNQLSPSLQALSPDTRATISQASNRKRRKLISDIWTEAEPIYNNEGKLVEGRCIHCGVKFAASRESSTSHMRRHLKVCEAKTSMDEMVAKMGRPDGLDPDWKFNPNLARRKLLKMIVINEMPFSLVEYRAFREFTRALNPWFENISRTTIKNDCVDAFKYHGDEMKEEFQYIASRISLTGDMWTSNQKLGYFCLTAHFITDAWKLHKYIIRFAMMETPHNSVNMFNLVLKSLQEWNIEDKLFSFTLDNAAVNISMVNSLRTNLNNKGFLVLGGKLLHFRCATHVFNLIVQDGLKVINNIPVILDPRYKYDLVEYLLSDFGTEKEADTWMGEVKKTMEELFSEYNKEFGEGESQSDTATEEVQDDGDPLARWDRYVRSKRQQSSNELERYLKEQLTPRKEEVDILHWWKTKSELYPVLSRIARDVLAIPASTVPSESAFSTGGCVISDYRTSLTTTTVEALICLQDWFKAAGQHFFPKVCSFGSYNILFVLHKISLTLSEARKDEEEE